MLPRAFGGRWHRQFRVLVMVEEKAAFPSCLGHAADMETATIAGAARAAELPWCALRAVSDRADEGLALDFGSLHQRRR